MTTPSTETHEGYSKLLACLLALLEDIEDSHDFEELRRRVKKTNEVVALERIPTLDHEPGEKP